MAAVCTVVFVCSLLLMATEAEFRQNNLTVLTSAVSKGAVCMDGSPPAYAYQKGSGNGSKSWIVFMEGGGWCTSIAECIQKTGTHLGSGYRGLTEGVEDIFTGILDSDIRFNPDFYNWHKVFIRYCDGSVFMSDVEKVDRQNNLTFRGARIYNAIMEEMLDRGMGNAENAILTGSSAGGMSTILHCDRFRGLFPGSSRVKCISDSGFIIRGKGGYARMMDNFFRGITKTHKLAKFLPKSCTSKRKPYLCLFPEYLIDDVETPLFLVESTFDWFQIGYSYIYGVAHQRPSEWKKCGVNLAFCNSTQVEIIKGFRPIMLETLMSLDYSSSRGIFVDSCFLHTHIQHTYGWMCSTVLAHKTIGQAVGDWYFDRSTFREIETDVRAAELLLYVG
ncbi:hypothetical protein C2S51_000020 [Perilla frutescens var. frutescens]|nr:hypothetical protein C2S51_000020 [Perilla frutescens var. frutescens]